MRRHAKASTAGSNLRQAKGLGRIFRGAPAERAAAKRAKGSGAPSQRRLVLAAFAVMVSLLALSAAVTSAAEPTEFKFDRAFGPDGTGSSGFSSAGSVAVDQSEDVVYVLDNQADALFKFDLEGTPVDFGGLSPNISGNELSGLALGGSAGERQVAVDSVSHTIYLTGENATALQAFQSNGEPALFTAGPEAGTNEITGFFRIEGVAIDANGDIYGADYGVAGNSTISIYRSTGATVLSFEPSLTGSANSAVNSEGALYVTINDVEVRRYAPSEFPVTPDTTYTADLEALDSNRPYSVAVDPATNDVYVAETEPAVQIAVFGKDGALQTTFGGPGEVGQLDFAPGVAVESKGQERVFVANEPQSGLSQVKIFKRLEDEPSIKSSAVTAVTADSATLRARINPHKSATTYRFEYGLSACSVVSACGSVPLGGAGIGAGYKVVAVAQIIAGLQPGTTYHYRVLAENALGSTVGPDHTFTTQVTGLGFRLADSRAWEMVSPPKKFAGNIRISSIPTIQAAADGNGLAYGSSVGSLDAEPDGNRAFEESANLAWRGAGGWHSKDITPPHTKVTSVRPHSEYRTFSPDLARAVVEPYDSTLLSPQASERTIYLRENTEPATYTPLVTGKEGFANVPLGTVFAEDLTDTVYTPPLEMMGANSALTHVVFVSRQAGLSPGAPLGSFYEWSGGQLQLINQLPVDEGGGTTQAMLGAGRGSVRHAVSEDGSRVFWSSSTVQEGYNATSIDLTALYARDTVAEEVVRLDVVRPGASGAGEATPAFHGASADGGVVFFTDSQQLTEDASPGGRDLYRCVVSFDEATPGCSSLTDISAPLAGSGESAEAQEMTSAITDDGTHVYFVARGVLDTTANEAGDSAAAGEPNLYLWRQGEGVRFIARLSEEDHSDWGKDSSGQATGYVSQVTAASSPSGRYFSFMSERSLTGYDNRDAISDETAQEVFRYDALADRMDCISCNPSGANPAGQEQSLLVSGSSTDPQGLWQGHQVAAILPEALVGVPFGGSSFHRPRAVLDNGRVFFNAFDSLVPADSNGEWDVYQYEPVGVGDCTASSAGASLSRSAGGCLSLLSSGTADEEAAFLDASVSGDDVFFITPARLSVTDEDSAPDVYDARVDGIPATLSPSNECLGEACQPPALAPNDPTPASATFKGQGNVKPNVRKRCAKGKRQVRRKGKSRCIAQKHHHRAGKSGRAGR